MKDRSASGGRAGASLRSTALRSLAVALLPLAGCAAQADLAGIRAEQRLLARRLADTRADVQAIKGDLARIRGQLDDLGYRRRSYTPPPPPPSDYDRYGEPGAGMPGEPPPPGSPGTSGSPYGSPDPYGSPGADPNDPRYGSAPPPSYPDSGAPPPAAAAPPSANLAADFAKGDDVDYRQGLESYQRGDYARAVQSLRRFVGKNPTNDAVPTAQYWIGESYYSQGKYNEAILAYNEILVAWPKSDRVPAALLRQATAFANLGDKIDARLILQKLISDHPTSQEAEQAKGQLRALGA